MRPALAVAAALALAACATAPAPEVARFDGARVTLRTTPAVPSPTAPLQAEAARLCESAGKVAEYAWSQPAPAAGVDHLFVCF